MLFFDQMLGARNSSQIDDFFTRGRQKALDVYCIRQCYFGLPRQRIRKNSGRRILFKQALGDVESLYKEIGGYDMKYDEVIEKCRKALSEKFNYLCFDMTRNKTEGKYRFFIESKNTYIECISESEDF